MKKYISILVLIASLGLSQTGYDIAKQIDAQLTVHEYDRV